MISRSDWEPLPTPTLSPFCACAPGYLSPCRFFHCRRVVCACSAGAVGSFSNKPLSPKSVVCVVRGSARVSGTCLCVFVRSVSDGTL